MNAFNRDYYENGKAAGLSCYENYRWLPELTIPMAQAIVDNCGIGKSDYILDFGCAKGYLVKALVGLGHLALGCDISEYALSQADEETRPYLFEASELATHFHWIICKDVLEHIPETELMATLRKLRNHTDHLFVAVPLGNNGEYMIPEMELDVTHCIRRPLWWWTGMIEEAGFKDVNGTFFMRGIKENWTRKFKFGNGFITAH